MKNTNRDELKSTNDSEVPWMAKGSKGSIRRDEKAIVRVGGSGVENEDKSSSGKVAKASELGKLQGQHVAERVGCVPMKKRRIMVASLSPRKSSGRRGSSEHRLKINHVSKLNPNLTDGGTSYGSDAKNDSIGHDFSGIVILADAACNLSNDLAPAVDCLTAEEPVVQQQDASTILAFGGMIAANKGESLNLAPDSTGAVTMSGEPTEKKKARFHWDLNVPMDAWGPPYDAEDDASGKDLEGETTKSMSPKERKPIDGSKDNLDGLVASDEQEKFSAPSGPKTKAAARNGNEFKSDYDSQMEDRELKEQYSWGRNEVEDGELEPKDYGLEPEDEGFYSMSESNANKMEDSCKRIMAETKSRSDIDMKDLHLRKGSSSSRRFASKPFKEFPSHDAIPRTRSYDYKELSMGPYRFYERDDMRPRYVLESPHPKCMMGSFHQSRLGSGQGSQPDHGYVRNRFSNRGYKGRLSMYPNGGDRVFRGRHGYNNQFPCRMHNWMSGNKRERCNSPVFRRSRSPSPVPWNVRDRLSSPHDGFRGDERKMERVRLPFQKRFSENQEIGLIMSPPRLFERRSYDSGENHDGFRTRSFWHGQGHDVGSSLRRLDTDKDNNFRPFRRHGRFEGAEDRISGNKFKMRQQKTRRDEVTEAGGDDMLDGSGFTKKERRW